MGSLKEVLRDAMTDYAVKGLNGYSELTMNTDQSLFTVVSTAVVKGKRTTTTSLIARIDNNQVFIDYDINNKPLVDALVQIGVPRTQIILSYADEPVPETRK